MDGILDPSKPRDVGAQAVRLVGLRPDRGGQGDRVGVTVIPDRGALS